MEQFTFHSWAKDSFVTFAFQSTPTLKLLSADCCSTIGSYLLFQVIMIKTRKKKKRKSQNRQKSDLVQQIYNVHQQAIKFRNSHVTVTHPLSVHLLIRPNTFQSSVVEQPVNCTDWPRCGTATLCETVCSVSWITPAHPCVTYQSWHQTLVSKCVSPHRIPACRVTPTGPKVNYSHSSECKAEFLTATHVQCHSGQRLLLFQLRRNLPLWMQTQTERVRPL